MKMQLFALLLIFALLLSGCAAGEPAPQVYSAGFGCKELPVPEKSDQPLYIAGYNNGKEITGVLDAQQARALWLDDGSTSIVLIVVDCVGLSSATVKQIRQRLAAFCRRTDCDSVNVISTHTHAGVDTLGLWGPVAISGKNDAFMETVIAGAVQAAEEAYANRTAGTLCYSTTKTYGLQRDSRDPQIFDNRLYQLCFTPDDGSKNGIRLFSFAAHAEALRSENTLVSRDYPGAVCDIIKAQTGDDAIYLPGAIGGLIMTPVLCGEPFDAKENLRLTGEKIASFALSAPEGEVLSPAIGLSRVEFEVELDNTLFKYYKFLGILENEGRRSLSGQYYLQTELTVLRLGQVTLALLPGEVFPELISRASLSGDPKPLREIAADYGVENFMVVGLANDELGYILPPSAHMLDEELPYFREAEGDHYEETNSVGVHCAHALAQAFEKALQTLK
ncbi:MAG: neutral/alkaline non-lysosomal ceramidase N-terminal domain-containing protein [Oscillospiraceae bacterium]|nr:neutral/alkaline non-lysosomal ceramidase N-terminal domain-containing protein [Oscillospiraceae bacterium]